MIKTELCENREDNLKSMIRVMEKQKEATSDSLAFVCNAIAIMNTYLIEINWVGLYIMRKGRLYLGPFQGRPACMEIGLDEGVCGHTATLGRSVIVPDVDLFPGHIACDSASRSELVVPILKDDEVIALIDIDSPIPDRFSNVERIYVEKAAEMMIDSIGRNWDI